MPNIKILVVIFSLMFVGCYSRNGTETAKKITYDFSESSIGHFVDHKAHSVFSIKLSIRGEYDCLKVLRYSDSLQEKMSFWKQFNINEVSDNRNEATLIGDWYTNYIFIQNTGGTTNCKQPVEITYQFISL